MERSPWSNDEECGNACLQTSIIRIYGTYDIIGNDFIFHPISAFDVTHGVEVLGEDISLCWAMNPRYETIILPNIVFEEDGVLFTADGYFNYDPPIRPESCGTEYIPEGAKLPKVSNDPSVYIF